MKVRPSLAAFCGFRAGNAAELLLLLGNSPLLPVSRVADALAVTVRTVLVTSHNHIVVPRVPALLLLLHAAVAPRFQGDGDRRGLTLSWRPLLAEREGILVLHARRDDGLVLAAVRRAGGS